MSSKLLSSTAPASVILIWVIVGWVCLSEGMQKFLFPAAPGVGRFTQIGIPHICWRLRNPFRRPPYHWTLHPSRNNSPALGISVAIWTTKISTLSQQGFWWMVHEARSDFCTAFGLFFLLAVGAGRLSLDARIQGSAVDKACLSQFSRSLRGLIRRHDRNGIA